MRYNWTLRGRAEGERAHPTTGRSPGAWAGLAAALAASMVIAGYAAVDPEPRARLSAVSATVGVRGASVLIEASEPVAYVTARPDPLTVVVDLRNVSAAGVVNRVSAAAAFPIAAVTTEDARGADGAPVARVRVLLAAPAQHQVRSERNFIHVDVVPDDNPPGTVRLVGPSPAPKAASPEAKPVAGAATRLEAVRTNAGAHGVEVTLAGNGTLVATNTELTATSPHRLILDFAGVTPSTPSVVPVAKGAIERVQVASYSTKPQVTRVVFELARVVPYTLTPSGNELKVSFAEGVDPTAAPTNAAAAARTLTTLSTPAESSDVKPAEVPAPPAAPVGQGTQAAAPVAPAPPPKQAQAAAAVVSQPPQQPGAAGRVYSGQPVSLDFQGADLRSVLRILSEISGLNLVIDPTVQGTVDVALRDVAWDQALDHILRSNKLGYVVDGTIVRVAPLNVLAEEEKARRELSDQQALSGDLKVITKTLSYAQAPDLEPLLKDNALSKRGTTAVDKRTNTIVINDLPLYLAKAEALLATLDQPEGQVEIEARIVSTSKAFARELGVKWGFLGQATPEVGNTTGVGFPNSDAGGAGIDHSVTAASSIAKLALGSINGSFNINAELTALEKDGKVRVLLQPRVVTQNNVQAKITRGQEIPYTTTVAPVSGGANVIQPMPTVQFKTAALTLQVTPRITPSDTIMLDVDVDNGSPGETQANGNVSINTQRAQTKVLVQNGATTVIGGIYGSQENRAESRTPGLGKVPILRWLFKNDSIKDSNEELLIFITPRVIRLK